MGAAVSRRLFLDIETSPLLVTAWEAKGKPVYIGPENIVEYSSIICVAWRWEGGKVTRSQTWDRDRCDKAMVQHVVGIMHKADEVVAHNGDHFDINWIRTRALFHKIPMSPEFASIDTLKASRGRFRFPSNRLDAIARYLDLGSKKPTGLGLWKSIAFGEGEQPWRDLARMVDYCKHDVLLLQQVFERMNPYLPPRTNRAEYISECPECGSKNTSVQKHRVTAAGFAKVQFQCQEPSCGKYHSIAESRYKKAKEEAEARRHA